MGKRVYSQGIKPSSLRARVRYRVNPLYCCISQRQLNTTSSNVPRTRSWLKLLIQRAVAVLSCTAAETGSSAPTSKDLSCCIASKES